MALARELGAETVRAGVQDVPAEVRRSTDGAGADVVCELVGTAESGALVYIGYSFDQVPLSPLSLVVPEQRILTSVGNRRSELVHALEMAASGRLRSHVVTRPLEDAADVLDDLRAGRVVGRAVLVP